MYVCHALCQQHVSTTNNMKVEQWSFYVSGLNVVTLSQICCAQCSLLLSQDFGLVSPWCLALPFIVGMD